MSILSIALSALSLQSFAYGAAVPGCDSVAQLNNNPLDFELSRLANNLRIAGTSMTDGLVDLRNQWLHSPQVRFSIYGSAWYLVHRRLIDHPSISNADAEALIESNNQLVEVLGALSKASETVPLVDPISYSITLNLLNGYIATEFDILADKADGLSCENCNSLSSQNEVISSKFNELAAEAWIDSYVDYTAVWTNIEGCDASCPATTSA